MQIKDVEELLQMTSYSLRYYERMGLIHPERDENGYRNYSKQDIQNLKKIRFLRELEIPVENIESILNDSISFQEILEKHMKTLSTQIKSLEYVQSICKDLKDKNIPLLDAMIDDQIISSENIDQKQMMSGLNRVVEYLKPVKTVVIGARETPRDFLKGGIVTILISIVCGFGLTVGIPNTINYTNNINKMNLLPSFEPSVGIFLLMTLISLIISFFILYKLASTQDYIELTDQKISICSKKFQSKHSIFLGMLLKQTEQRNKVFQYDELEKVEIKLIFATTSGGHSGLWNIYVPKFIFSFRDGHEYSIESGLSFGESTKDAYHILQQKKIFIEADDTIVGYFDQDEKKGFDYFEAIYHHNGKRVR